MNHDQMKCGLNQALLPQLNKQGVNPLRERQPVGRAPGIFLGHF